MPNWFFTDATGHKCGPINDQQLKALAEQGTISPNTLLETETGQKGKAGQIRGLFNTPSSQSAATSEVNRTTTQSVPMPAIEKNSNVPSPLVIGIIIACIIFAIGGIGIGLMIGSRNNDMPVVAPEGKEQVAAPVVVPKAKKEVTSPVIVEQVNNAQPQKNLELSLKEPPEKSVFVNNMKNQYQKYVDSIDLEKIMLNRMQRGERLDDIGLKFLEIRDSMFERCYIRAEKTFLAGNSFDNENLLIKMSKLKDCFDDSVIQISDIWLNSIKYDFIPDPNAIIGIMVSANIVSNHEHNLEQMMSSVRESVRTLDKAKYENTIKLYAVLSQYEKAVTNPSGSYKSYTENRASYREEFNRTMSLAELEW